MVRQFSAPDSAVTEATSYGPAPADPHLVRGMRVTWWYTFGGILVFEIVFLLFAAILLAGSATGLAATALFVISGGGWIIVTALLLADYRRTAITGDDPSRWRVGVALGLTVLFSLLLLSWGVWSVALMPLVQVALLLKWPSGVRSRLTAVLTLLLVILAVVDGTSSAQQRFTTDAQTTNWWFVGLYVCVIPLMSVFSLWWWDVVVRLDHARAAEGRLAATQERLRVATDVHDLQGHHLQVIALQLELAERLMQRDPEAALVQLSEARRSVDAARQGTRDLAKPFVGVPVADELANAADLLRAAGASVELTVSPDAAEAPAEVFGPVIRETTTNILKHGGGAWARLSLDRDGTRWRYRVVNDLGVISAVGTRTRVGTGIDGMQRRLAEVGGTLDATRTDVSFVVTAVTA